MFIYSSVHFVQVHKLLAQVVHTIMYVSQPNSQPATHVVSQAASYAVSGESLYTTLPWICIVLAQRPVHPD